MSQHPRSVPSGSGLAVREGFNNALDSAFTLNSGPVPPASPQAGLLWLDTATGVLKIRNDANTNWVSLLDRLGGAGSGQVVRHDIAQALALDARKQAAENIAAVSYDTQTLTDAQRVQARNNIRAALNPDSAQGGSWYRIFVPANTAMVVPAGGRWACLYVRRNTTNGGINGVDAGVHVGGTNLFTTTSNEDAHMLVWRVA